MQVTGQISVGGYMKEVGWFKQFDKSALPTSRHRQVVHGASQEAQWEICK